MPLLDLSPSALAFAVFALFVGGMVKGTVGLGMKVVVLGLLATIVELPVAIAIIILPAVATNVWQVFGGPPLREALRQTWVLFLAFCVGIWLGTETWRNPIRRRWDVELSTRSMRGTAILPGPPRTLDDPSGGHGRFGGDRVRPASPTCRQWGSSATC